jgi:hypothetical protein
MSEPIYVGIGKEKVFTDGGRVVALSFSAKDLETMMLHVNSVGWVNVDLYQRRAVGPKGQTHYCKINQWQPKQPDGEAAPRLTVPEDKAADEQKTMPF